MIRRIVMAITLMLGFAGVVDAVPVQIRSESLVVEQRKSTAEFKGSVHLQRQEFELQCDRLVVFYQESGGELDHAEAYGNVVMHQGEKRGAADKAIYKQAAGMLILMGNARMEDPNGVIQGEKVIHNINTTETTVQKGSGGERVRFFSEEEELDNIGKKRTPSSTGEVTQ